MAESIELTDLEVITRYSLAVRGASADRSEVIEALRADLAWLEGGRAKKVPARRTPAKKAASKRTTR